MSLSFLHINDIILYLLFVLNTKISNNIHLKAAQKPKVKETHMRIF